MRDQRHREVSVSGHPPAAPDAARCFPPLGPHPSVLLVWPEIPPSFWSFRGILRMIRCQAVMPPLGLLTLAAMCPPGWRLRLIDQAVERLTDGDLEQADLVMVSGMHVQKDSMRDVLQRCRRLGRRTIVGGPYASSQPDVLLELADHVVEGEADEAFGDIAAELENGSARSHYRIAERPGVGATPVPRFDLLRLDRYASMPIQFSRGCPFQCEFCDIITLYGRKPRTKEPAQVVAELEALHRLGWHKEVFIVDDNFIGNRRRALELVEEIARWQQAHAFPFAFYTEASIDLAQHPDLIDAMLRANFFYVFIGIESPSREALIETRKTQNLRQNPLHSLHLIQSRGLWVTGGFIVGFDADGEDIFDRQVDFITEAAIPWAMIGFLQAPPTTPLFDRLAAEDRLIHDSSATSNFSLPNFHTRLPRAILLRGLRDTLARLYDAGAFYERSFQSLWRWKPPDTLVPPHFSPAEKAAIFCQSIVRQGILGGYRRAYWAFLWRLLRRWGAHPQKLWLGFTLLLSGNHFVPYAAEVVATLDAELTASA